jgi:hypothetical protein
MDELKIIKDILLAFAAAACTDLANSNRRVENEKRQRG